MWWKILLLPLFGVTIFGIFYLPPPQSDLGSISRLIFFHVSSAWVAVVAFLVSMINSARYLQKRDLLYDLKASSSARLGFVFCILATISGALFAKAAWGSYWNWDPRETTVFVLLLIYGAYFSLRSAVMPGERKASLSSVYSIVAFLTVPFLVFVLPRAYQTLHPNTSIINENSKFGLPIEICALLILCLVGMSLIFIWIYQLEIRVKTLDHLKNKEQDVS